MTDVELTIKTAYLCGPMRGYEDHNFPMFHKATSWLRRNGWGVFSPAERDEEDDSIPTVALSDPNHVWEGTHDLAYFMQYDLPAVCQHEAVVCLPNWENSQGARLETMVAVEIGHPVFEITGKDGTAPALYSEQNWQLSHVSPDYIRGIFAGETLKMNLGPDPGFVECECYGEKKHVLSEDCWCNQPQNSIAHMIDPTDDAPSMRVKEEQVCEEDTFQTISQRFRTMRIFDTGATRNVETDPDYHGFFSPLSMHAYGEYMHAHRLQADGTMRDSNNWQLGMPQDSFVRSLVRHAHDVELIHDGYKELARSDVRDPSTLKAHLSAIIFNAQGMLHFLVKEDIEAQREAEPYSMFDEILRQIPCR